MNSKILFLGGSGFIGQEIIPLMKSDGYQVEYPNSDDLNLLDSSSTDSFFKDKFYEVIIFSSIVGRKTHLQFNSDEFYDNMISIPFSLTFSEEENIYLVNSIIESIKELNQ